MKGHGLKTERFDKDLTGFVILRGGVSWVWKSRLGNSWYEPHSSTIAALLSVVIAMRLSFAYKTWVLGGITATLPYNAFIIAFVSFFSVLLLWLILRRPVYAFTNFAIIRFRYYVKIQDCGEEHNYQNICSEQIVHDMFLGHKHRMNTALAIREYNKMHTDNNVPRVALILEDSRYLTPPEKKIHIDELASKAVEIAVLGEEEPVGMPVHLRLSALTYFMPGLLVIPMLFSRLYMNFKRTASMNITDLITQGNAVSTGLFLGFLGILTVVVLHEIGVLPLGAWRGQCSLKETVVFKRNKWVRFHPDKDLAMARFVDNDVADVVLMSSDGTHAVCRLAGPYLWHFIACWAYRED